MRVAILVAAALAGGCMALKEVPGSDGVGGDYYGPTGTGGQLAAADSGAPETCDWVCDAAVFWGRYVAAVAIWKEDQEASDRAYSDAYSAAHAECLADQCPSGCGSCHPNCDCAALARQTAENDQVVKDAPVKVAADLQSARDLYAAYSYRATQAGQVPMAKLTP